MDMVQITPETVSNFAEEVHDVTEETFSLFSQNIPSNNLGILDSKSNTILVETAGQEYEIRQSSGLLTSTRAGGTTGAVLWKITPLLVDWIVNPQCCLWKHGILNSRSTVVELGCGVAGLVGLSLGRMVSRYVLTDQEYVMKLLRENVQANRHSGLVPKNIKSTKHSKQIGRTTTDNLFLVELDWESDSVQVLTQLLDSEEVIDMVLLCDCVYNIYLIRPLTQICIDICSLHPTRRTVLMIAQQLRTDDVFQDWMESLSEPFVIWRISDSYLPENLRSNSGYVVHLAMLKPGEPT